MSILYEILLWLFAPIIFLKVTFQRIFHGKYRQNFWLRWGRGFPTIDKGNRRLIWVHAVSMGETRAVSAIVKKLKASDDHPLILVSSMTETGHAEAKRSMPEADFHVYLPYDFYAIIHPIVVKTAPDYIILCETDFWYNFLRSAKKCGAEVALVNGKISERSLKRFQLFPSFAKALFDCIDIFCVQSDHYLQRFIALGIPQNKMVVTGNLKFDVEPVKLEEGEKTELKRQWGIVPGDKILTIGSTHDPEERLCLGVVQELWKTEPSLKVVLVPRHPERFAVVAALLKSMEISFYSHTQNDASAASESRVILVDAMGLLCHSYQISDVAIVAGSYTERVGGHNILEPLWFGVPTVFGPYMNTQPELTELVLSHKAGLQVPIGELAETLRILLQNSLEAEELRKNGLGLVASMRGSSDRTLEALRVSQRSF